MNIFVAKLSSVTKAEDLQELFSKFGEVISAKVIMDRETGFSKRYGFVEMADDRAGYEAIEKLNNSELDGSQIISHSIKAGELCLYLYKVSESLKKKSGRFHFAG